MEYSPGEAVEETEDFLEEAASRLPQVCPLARPVR